MQQPSVSETSSMAIGTAMPLEVVSTFQTRSRETGDAVRQGNALDVDPSALWRILDVSRQLSAPTDLATTLSHVMDAAREVLRADRGSVLLYEAQTDELYTKVSTGSDGFRFKADRGIAGECARQKRLINVGDCYSDLRFNPEIDLVTGYRTRCLLAVPLIGDDEALVGVMQILNKNDGVFDSRDERIATILAAHCAVALQRARLLESQMVKQKLERDLALAREIQLRVLPAHLPALPGYELAGFSQPADETGGDIYDAAMLGADEVMLLLGDATGHGIGPALSVTQVRAMFRMALRLRANLDQTFFHINSQLVEDLGGDRFVTAFMGRLDARNHRVTYHAGGQAPLLHFHAAAARCEWLGATTIPLGILSDVDIGPAHELALGPGDILALVSDGVFEHPDPYGDPFSMVRLADIVASHHAAPMHDLLARIREQVAEFACGVPQADDMTILLVKRL